MEEGLAGERSAFTWGWLKSSLQILDPKALFSSGLSRKAVCLLSPACGCVSRTAQASPGVGHPPCAVLHIITSTVHCFQSTSVLNTMAFFIAYNYGKMEELKKKNKWYVVTIHKRQVLSMVTSCTWRELLCWPLVILSAQEVSISREWDCGHRSFNIQAWWTTCMFYWRNVCLGLPPIFRLCVYVDCFYSPF